MVGHELYQPLVRQIMAKTILAHRKNIFSWHKFSKNTFIGFCFTIFPLFVFCRSGKYLEVKGKQSGTIVFFVPRISVNFKCKFFTFLWNQIPRSEFEQIWSLIFSEIHGSDIISSNSVRNQNLKVDQ